MISSRDQLAAIVDALVNPRRVKERIPYWDAARHKKFREHTVKLPPLLDALREAAYPGCSGDDQESARQPPGSRPPLNLDAVNRGQAIHLEVTRGLNRLNLDGRANLEDDLRLLAVTPMPSEFLDWIVLDARSWQVWAEIACHERGVSWVPDAPCPCCDQRNAVRVRPDNTRAYCGRCEAIWDEDTIGILARHVAEWSKEGRARWTPKTPAPAVEVPLPRTPCSPGCRPDEDEGCTHRSAPNQTEESA